MRIPFCAALWDIPEARSGILALLYSLGDPHTANLGMLKRTMKFYTIGYGGRGPAEFTSLLVMHGVRSIADVRIHPERASMARTSRPDPRTKESRNCSATMVSLTARFSSSAICFATSKTGASRTALMERVGDLLVERLDELPEPFCLMCAEKRVADCHRHVIAEFLVATRGWSVEHIE